MSFRGDYYEALTWNALEIAFARSVTYEPSREIHSCENLCQHRTICKKPQIHSRLIHTIPDFLVELKYPLFVHVCYWDSKETSHAKFWRTISEIVELKCFVPNAQSMCIIFEAEHDNGIYRSLGWYPEFLRALHLISDRAVFFSHPKLIHELERTGVSLRERAGTAKIYEEIASKLHSYDSLKALSEAIRNSKHPTQSIASELKKLWWQERDFCATVLPYTSIAHSGERIRNAVLQLILMMGIFTKSCTEVLETLELLQFNPRKPFPGKVEVISTLTQLPISHRDGEYQFLATNLRASITGDKYCDLNDDLRWLLLAKRDNALPIKLDALVEAVESTYAEFRLSPQVEESLGSIKQVVLSSQTEGALTSLKNWSEEDWLEKYEGVPIEREYNLYAELLIEAIGLGTYPLVRHFNQTHTGTQISRNELRGLYSNRRSAKNELRRKDFIRKLVKLIPKDRDLEEVGRGYLLRKTSRLVGPQSAINPLEHLVLAIIQDCSLVDGVSVLTHGIVLDTLASNMTGSRQLGTWRVSLAIQTPLETIPIYISGMKSPGDCAHKAREFPGHLRLARYKMIDEQIDLSSVKRGIAVLEGGYTDDDKRAFHLSGYRVCSLMNLTDVLIDLQLAR